MSTSVNDLPDAVLCNILSLLPTKESVATCVVSKRWKSLWRSVLVLDFNYDNDDNETNSCSLSQFVKWVNAFILSRDMDQPLLRFALTVSPSCDPVVINSWVAAAAQRSVQSLDLSLGSPIHLSSSSLLSCKTLVLLKLSNVHLSLNSCTLCLRRLKTLHLSNVTFSQDRDLAQLLLGSPNLEHLDVCFLDFKSYTAETKFIRLSKLMDHMNFIPKFENLIHLKFGPFTKGLILLELIELCPQLQVLAVYRGLDEVFAASDEAYPESVPSCISLHLRTCTFKNYKGSEAEFQFIRYIMQHASNLETMTVISNHHDLENEGDNKSEMLRKLSLCSRCSTTCKLFFE